MTPRIEILQAIIEAWKAKDVDADGDHIVQLTTRAFNQRDQNVMPGTAVIVLPRRAS